MEGDGLRFRLLTNHHSLCTAFIVVQKNARCESGRFFDADALPGSSAHNFDFGILDDALPPCDVTLNALVQMLRPAARLEPLVS